jgi:ribonuclease P protein component
VTSAGEPARATLSASQRLKTQRHFKRVYQRGRRASGQWMTVVACFGRPRPIHGEATNDGRARVGLSVSKDHGGAVRRNKIKRLLREAFRLEQHQLPGELDVVLIPRRRDDHYPLAALRLELVELVARLQRDPGPDRRRSKGRSGSPP